jgi:DNA-binding IclR family transcriptional regulator
MPHEKTKSDSGIQSIQRAVAILRKFTETEPELGVTELSRRLRLHKSTVSRILSTLQSEGLVGQDPETGKYRLGLGLISLAGVALGRIDVRGIAQRYLDTLVEVTRETINVVVLDSYECITVEHVPSPQSIRYVGWIGRRTPLHCTASGKIFLAYMPANQRSKILALPLAKYTEKTIMESQVLEQSLAQIRQQGYAIVVEEFLEGFSAIAAPIFNHTGQIVAAVSIAGPTYRLDLTKIETFVNPIREVARLISAELGYVEA